MADVPTNGSLHQEKIVVITDRLSIDFIHVC